MSLSSIDIGNRAAEEMEREGVSVQMVDVDEDGTRFINTHKKYFFSDHNKVGYCSVVLYFVLQVIFYSGTIIILLSDYRYTCTWNIIHIIVYEFLISNA